MQHLVFYKSEKGHLGNIDCKFLHNPPCIKDVRELENDISERMCGGCKVVVTGWSEIQDEDDIEKSTYQDMLSITVQGQVIHVNDMIRIADGRGICEYTVELGKYTWSDSDHVGWYLKLISTNESYPEDCRIYCRPLLDILNKDLIPEFELIKQ